jgi:hypothetical protein
MSVSASISRHSRSRSPATPALTAFLFAGLVMVAVRMPRSPMDKADVLIGGGVDGGHVTVPKSLTSVDDRHAEQRFTHDVALHIVGAPGDRESARSDDDSTRFTPQLPTVREGLMPARGGLVCIGAARQVRAKLRTPCQQRLTMWRAMSTSRWQASPSSI